MFAIKESHYDKCVSGTPLSGVKYIVTSDRLKTHTERLRALWADRDPGFSKAKVSLPAFYPAFHSTREGRHAYREVKESGDYLCTGVVQIDIDRQDNPGMSDDLVLFLRKIVALLPFCIYTYISPRMGLKAGFATDLFDTAIYPVGARLFTDKLLFHMGVDGAVKVDKNVSNMFHASALCFDPDAFFRTSPDRAGVSDLAIKRVKGDEAKRIESIKRRKRASLVTPYREKRGVRYIERWLSRRPIIGDYEDIQKTSFHCFMILREAGILAGGEGDYIKDVLIDRFSEFRKSKDLPGIIQRIRNKCLRGK